MLSHLEKNCFRPEEGFQKYFLGLEPSLPPQGTTRGSLELEGGYEIVGGGAAPGTNSPAPCRHMDFHDLPPLPVLTVAVGSSGARSACRLKAKAVRNSVARSSPLQPGCLLLGPGVHREKLEEPNGHCTGTLVCGGCTAGSASQWIKIVLPKASVSL